MVLIFIINLAFAVIYYKIYQSNNKSFKNIYTDENKPIDFHEFIYYSYTLFFTIGYDVIPQTKLVKFLSILHLNVSFIVTSIYISRYISNW